VGTLNNMEDFKKILKEISENLNNVAYEYGDYSDIGNEIGFVLGKTITKDELEDFLAGLRHGISLSDGTHP
jgi:hypothetical protein